ncbi:MULTISPECIES: MFS transporter [unclassified Pseudomonas]|uniref:MFS transporter n=1 Tax=unclassified Pseudomonas TaxID=196821 RepID=UPI00119A94BE|nr:MULTISPECIES: MFS transporter [unclassified Pseudomonas]TWC23066.1 DHA1 family multidrug/chloramphenicol efflux transport protein-like MFS transporter [Pseudomonas sp. SJZ075]TWC24670.1 DHA1 family multidrug/chloramphenicol efflux transport protein-like MFS transporter [Pseudomonas sp. SJZ074]TWC38054.1 DHA1 family multidrug/chloramphenicol efflux transport protein-like MFS transporter [Pseudomonas sp. SJZ078]TWC41113.1 DHA1 family multidrug/chloramphenicol efflux transport protein-like MFS 
MPNLLTTFSPKRLTGFCLAIALFELLTYMASDLIMPAMLAVTEELGAASDQIPYAFNLYLLGGILLPWLIGPLSDSHGRRPFMLAGCAGFVLACAAATQVTQMLGFNGLRLIQGMGLGFVIAVSYPAIQDLFNESDAVKIMALLGNLALLSPLLGPLLGGLLLQWLSWRELFLLLAGLGAVSWLALWGFMPRHPRPGSQRPPPVPFELRALIKRYGALLSDPRFMAASVALGLMSLPLIAWIGLSPLLLIQGQGVTPLVYGLWQIPVFAAVILGNLLLNAWVERIGVRGVLLYSLWPLCAGLLALVIASRFALSLPALVGGLSLYALGLGLGNAALYRLALFASDDSKGLVSAMVGMISIAVMSAAGTLLALLGAGNSLESFALMAGIAGLSCPVALCLFRSRPVAPV